MQRTVIANRAEIDVHRDFFSRHGCLAPKGFLLGRALPNEDFEAFARSA